MLRNSMFRELLHWWALPSGPTLHLKSPWFWQFLAGCMACPNSTQPRSQIGHATAKHGTWTEAACQRMDRSLTRRTDLVAIQAAGSQYFNTWGVPNLNWEDVAKAQEECNGSISCCYSIRTAK